MKPKVNDSYFYILSKPVRLDLVDELNHVQKKVDAFSLHFNKVDKKFRCRLAKACYVEDIKSAEVKFSALWNAVESLKAQCKGEEWENPLAVLMKDVSMCLSSELGHRRLKCSRNTYP